MTLLAFVFALGGTYFTWHWSSAAVREKRALILDEEIDYFMSEVNTRYQIYHSLLQGMRGLFAASQQVNNEEFTAYLESFHNSTLFPSRLTAFYNERFPSESKADPAAPALARLFPVLYTFPEKRGMSPAGQDSLPGGDIIVRAVREGLDAAAKILDDPDSSPDVSSSQRYMMSVPVYKKNPDLTDAERRIESLQGFVSLVFPLDELFGNTARSGTLFREIQLELHDITNPSRPAMLYHHPAGREPALENSGSVVRYFDFSGRKWIFHFYAPRHFGLDLVERHLALLTLAAGSFITLLVTGMIFFLVKSYQQNIRHTQGISRELDDSKEHLSLALQAAGVAMWDWDIIQDRVMVDENTRQRYGRTGDDPLNLESFLNTVHPGDRIRVQREIMACVEAESDFETSYRIVREDGAVRVQATHGRVYRDISGKAVRMTGAAWDITNLKRAEESSRRSEINYRNMIENSGDGILIVSMNEGCILFANHAAEILFGKKAGSLLGTQFGFPIISDKTSEINLIPEGGKRRIVEFHATQSEWEEKPAVLVFLRDVTERKELEAQVIQSQKMEAVGQLTGGIAHDFNNLLTVINGYSEMYLLSIKTENRPVKPVLEEILKAGKKAAALTSQLLVFSRRQIMHPQIVDMNRLIEDLDKMLRRLITENIELRALPGQGLWKVKVDKGQFEQVIMNLVINSRDAMPSGGTLTLETRNVHCGREYAERYLNFKPGPYVVLTVADTGCGMSEETKKRIFEPFFTTKEQGKGTGLGLATVYGIIKQANGLITVLSEPGKGSSFKVYIPAVSSEENEIKSEEIPSMETFKGTETILVVEDEQQVRSLVVDVLQSCGYQILAAANGEEGALLSEKLHDKPISLIVTDAVMPQMSGMQMVARIRPRRPGIKVLFISGYVDNLMTEKEITSGQSEFLHKPFSGIELARKVREILNKIGA